MLKAYPATFYVAFASVFVQVHICLESLVTGCWGQAAWMLVWVIAAACSLHEMEKNKESDSYQGTIYFFFLVSFYWTSQGKELGS